MQLAGGYMGMGYIGIIVTIIIGNVLQTIIILNAFDNFLRAMAMIGDRSGEAPTGKK